MSDDKKVVGTKGDGVGTQPSAGSLMVNLRGIFIIARSDVLGHIKSVRMLVLTLIFALSVIGGAFVFAGLSVSTSEIETPEFLVWTYVINADSGNQPNDALIITTDIDGRPVSGVAVSMYFLNDTSIDEKITNENGRAVFLNFSSLEILFDSKKDDYEVNDRPVLMPDGQLGQLLSEQELYVQAQTVDLDEDNVPDDVAILLLDDHFQPVPNAYVELSGRKLDNPATNGFGLFRDFNRLKDKYTYELTKEGSTVESTANIYADDNDIENLFDLEGPDEVLVQVAGLFFGLIVPVMAIGISFDSISSEKVSKSIIFLLCRPYW